MFDFVHACQRLHLMWMTELGHCNLSRLGHSNLSRNQLFRRLLRPEKRESTSKKRAKADFEIGFTKFWMSYRERCRFWMRYDPVDEQKSRHQNRRDPKFRFSLKCQIFNFVFRRPKRPKIQIRHQKIWKFLNLSMT